MRHITKKKQVSFASLAEIRQALAAESERLADHGLKGGGPRSRVAASAHLLNWLSCWFLRLIPAERERIAVAGKAIFDRIAASDEPVYFDLSVAVRSMNPGAVSVVGLGVDNVGDHVDHVDSQGQDQPPKGLRKPRRGA